MSKESDRELLVAVGSRVRAARTAQDLTLEQLARLTGISSSALSLIETAKRDARLTTLGRIATALRIPFAVLFEAGSSDAFHLVEGRRTEGSAEGYDIEEFL